MPKSEENLYNDLRSCALDDSDLENVNGGYQVVFEGEGANRDSWFVSFVTRRLIETKIRHEINLSPGIPAEIEIEGRKFKVMSVGETIHVEEIL